MGLEIPPSLVLGHAAWAVEDPRPSPSCRAPLWLIGLENVTSFYDPIPSVYYPNTNNQHHIQREKAKRMMLSAAIFGMLKPPTGNTARANPKEDSRAMCGWLSNSPMLGERFWQQHMVTYCLNLCLDVLMLV